MFRKKPDSLFSENAVGGGVDTVNVDALVDIVVKIQVAVEDAADKCKNADGPVDIDIDVALKVVVDLIVVSCILCCMNSVPLSFLRVSVLLSRLSLTSVSPLTSVPF